MDAEKQQGRKNMGAKNLLGKKGKKKKEALGQKVSKPERQRRFPGSLISHDPSQSRPIVVGR